MIIGSSVFCTYADVLHYLEMSPLNIQVADFLEVNNKHFFFSMLFDNVNMAF